SMRRFGLRNVLVVGQVAVSLLLLVGSALFLRSLMAAQTANTGIGNRNLAMGSFEPASQNNNAERSMAIARSVLAAVQSIPGVIGASLTGSVPLGLEGTQDAVVDAEKRNDWERNRIISDIYYVTPEYFAT